MHLRGLDFSSWQSLLVTILGLTLVTLLGVGIRLLTQMTFQQRRERMNRQINERLKTLIAAYKVLGGSFTGDLTVDPAHLRDLRRREQDGGAEEPMAALDLSAEGAARSDRTRRIRDAVEAALSDIILLGTEEHVRLADRAVRELVAGHPVHTHELVVSLRAFVRDALDLDPIPADPRVRRRPAAAEAVATRTMPAEAEAAAVVWVAAAGLVAAAWVTMYLATIRTMSRRRTRTDKLSLPNLGRDGTISRRAIGQAMECILRTVNCVARREALPAVRSAYVLSIRIRPSRLILPP
jgi:hypothetical protein